MRKEHGGGMTQGGGLPKWLLIAAAATALVVSPIDLAWYGGSIDLTIPKSSAVNLDLRGDKIKVDPLTNFSGSKDDDSMTGTLNGGGVPVRVRGNRITLAMR